MSIAVSGPQSNRKIQEACIACRGDLKFAGPQASFEYFSCSDCETLQLAPMPSTEAVQLAYQSSKFATVDHGQSDADSIYQSSSNYYHTLADVLSIHRVNGVVVDCGAGWGGLTKLLCERNFDCRGLELSEKMVSEAKKRGLPVEQGSVEQVALMQEKVQAIVLCGVFEHLTDPTSFLNHAATALDKDGLIVSLQPTANFAHLLAKLSKSVLRQKELPRSFWIFDAPWHVALYSCSGMKTIFERHNFELVEVVFTPQGRVSGWYGAVQLVTELVNKLGWRLVGAKWPLLVSHTFVFRKIS